MYVYKQNVSDGGSLASRIKKLGSLPERTIQSYTFQLLDSLKYIHAKNIVHRDIKGQNILVTRDDQIKLIDFGCGKRLRRSMHNADALKTMRGTPYWMSPEVITGNGHGIKSDIWSLACTVFEMLSGHPPWFVRFILSMHTCSIYCLLSSSKLALLRFCSLVYCLLSSSKLALLRFCSLAKKKSF